jgi:hypothetical protein
MNKSIIVRGYLHDLMEFRAKNGDVVAFGRIGEKSCEHGNNIRLIFFKSALNKCQNILKYDEVVILKGDLVDSTRWPETFFIVSDIVSKEEYESCKSSYSIWDFLTDISVENERDAPIVLEMIKEVMDKVIETHGLKRVRDYKTLTDDEILKYQALIELPNTDYPHYEPLIVAGISVQEHKDINPIAGERFLQSNYIFLRSPFYAKILFVSNYGRIIYDNEIICPFIVGTFLHCQKVYIKNMGEYYIHRIVKETFDPMVNMGDLYVHHINNNALDNRLENLLWVTETDHNKIHENNFQLMAIGRLIYERNKKELLELFTSNNDKIYHGTELITIFPNVFSDVVKNNIYSLLKEKIICDLSEKDNALFNNRIFSLNQQI